MRKKMKYQTLYGMSSVEVFRVGSVIQRHMRVTSAVVKAIATALDISRLDYCNSLFHNAFKDITKLQRVQNCFIDIVSSL